MENTTNQQDKKGHDANIVLAVSGLTPELFCKVHSQMYGETIDKLEQVDGQIFDGKELYELCAAICQAACASGAVDKTVCEDNELKWHNERDIFTYGK